MNNLNGHPIRSALVVIPHAGIPTAEVMLGDDGVISGAAVLTIGTFILTGVIIDPGGVATDGLAGYLVVGGAGGWRRELPPRGYRNDLGQSLVEVLTDAAAEAGEALSVDMSLERLDNAYARPGLPAWDVFRELPWWVDPATGVTHVGPRLGGPIAPLVMRDASVTSDERTQDRMAVHSEDVGAWMPGRTIGGRTIREVRIYATQAGVTITLMFAPNSLREQLSRLREGDLTYAYHYEYTVDSQTLDGFIRVSPVDGAPLLPPLDGRKFWPGAAGHKADFPAGTRVLVVFVGGRRDQPRIVGVAPPDEGGMPSSAYFDAEQDVRLGGGSKLVAREGDPVRGMRMSVFTAPDGSKQVSFVDSNNDTFFFVFAPPSLGGGLATMTPAVGISTPPYIDLPYQSKTYA